MSQLASFLSERPKESLPSEQVTNPSNSSQAHMVEEDQMNQCNVVHILRSRKKVVNQVSMPSNLIQHNHMQASTSSSSNPSKSDESKKHKSTSRCTSL